MATLDEAHQQLQTWIAEIDQRIEGLSLQRRAMAATLVALGHGNLPDRTAEAVSPVEPPPPAKPLPKGMPARLTRKKQAPSGPGGSRYDYVEVARVALAAQRAGEPMGPAVSRHFGVGKAMGPWLVKEARRRGFLPAANVAQPPAAEPVAHQGSRAFTPADTLRILEGGSSVG